jgi:hypothetical protein
MGFLAEIKTLNLERIDWNSLCSTLCQEPDLPQLGENVIYEREKVKKKKEEDERISIKSEWTKHICGIMTYWKNPLDKEIGLDSRECTNNVYDTKKDSKP